MRKSATKPKPDGRNRGAQQPNEQHPLATKPLRIRGLAPRNRGQELRKRERGRHDAGLVTDGAVGESGVEALKLVVHVGAQGGHG